jgi:RES domain
VDLLGIPRAIVGALLGERDNPYVWRLGHIDSPLDYIPHELCSWEHRFDDPRREYRSLYCAELKETCLREVLADLRPDSRARAEYAQFQRDQGIPPEDIHQPSRTVDVEWRQSNALARATVDRNGTLVDLNDPAVLEELAGRHAELLLEHGMRYLNISEIRSKNRIVTQTISRDLYERGAAGVRFRSNQDDRLCLALMEGRARLVPAGEPIPLTEDIPELLQVCSDYGLVLKRPPQVAPAPRSSWRP